MKRGRKSSTRWKGKVINNLQIYEKYTQLNSPWAITRNHGGREKRVRNRYTVASNHCTEALHQNPLNALPFSAKLILKEHVYCRLMESNSRVRCTLAKILVFNLVMRGSVLFVICGSMRGWAMR